MNTKLSSLNQKIIRCSQCPRLVQFRKKISKEKRKQYLHETYWGRPTPGFGDAKSKIIIFGLAPAAHGATRTGRVFTGDKSGDFLFKCLYKAGLSNQISSTRINDGLKLSCFITNVLKCVPPKDKPKLKELSNCSHFLENELLILSKAKILVTIGKVAFEEILRFYKKRYGIEKKIYIFGHGKKYMLPDNKILISSYHTSPRNFNTGLINEKKITDLFKVAKKIAER